jgi:hypothetical protein
MNTKTLVTNHITYDVESGVVQCVQYVTSHTKDYSCVVMIPCTKYNCCFNQNHISTYEVSEAEKFLHQMQIIY